MGEERTDEGGMGWFSAFSAVRNGGEKGAVGFDHKTAPGKETGGFLY